MKKIAVFLYDYTLFGGAERVAANLANELCRDYEVSLISCFAERETPSFPLRSEVRVCVLHKETISMALHCRALAKTMRRYLTEAQIDVVLNITAGVNTVSRMATRRSRVKVVYCEHSNLFNKTYGKKHEFRQWLGAKTADRSIALTATDMEEFRRKYGIGDKAGFIYNWYDGPVCRSYDADSKRIIAVGRLKSIKGYDRMIAAASKVFALHPDWSLDIYGEGSERDAIARQISDAGMERNIFLRGNCSAIMEQYRSHAFCVMTSYYEGFALALVEALANSLPAVSFDCPTGPREIIDDGVNGFLIPDGDIDALADAMNQLIEDPQLRLRLAGNAPDTVKKFDREAIYQQWVQVIEDLTANA